MMRLYDAIIDVDPVSAFVYDLWLIVLPIAAVVIVAAVIILVQRKREKAKGSRKDE